MSSGKNMSLFLYRMLWNLVALITHIYLVAHVGAEKHQVLALWRAHLTAKKAQLRIHVVSVSRVKI
jgi:hypothetical protein